MCCCDLVLGYFAHLSISSDHVNRPVASSRAALHRRSNVRIGSSPAARAARFLLMVGGIGGGRSSAGTAAAEAVADRGGALLSLRRTSGGALDGIRIECVAATASTTSVFTTLDPTPSTGDDDRESSSLAVTKLSLSQLSNASESIESLPMLVTDAAWFTLASLLLRIVSGHTDVARKRHRCCSACRRRSFLFPN